jgi:hypothetical protein
MRAKSIQFPQTYQIRRMLGLNPGKLPTNTTEQRFYYQGLYFRLLPAKMTPALRSRPHRLEVLCNVCGKWMSAGRFNQHQGIHPRETLSELSLNWIKPEYRRAFYEETEK